MHDSDQWIITLNTHAIYQITKCSHQYICRGRSRLNWHCSHGCFIPEIAQEIRSRQKISGHSDRPLVQNIDAVLTGIYMYSLYIYIYREREKEREREREMLINNAHFFSGEGIGREQDPDQKSTCTRIISEKTHYMGANNLVRISSFLSISSIWEPSW